MSEQGALASFTLREAADQGLDFSEALVNEFLDQQNRVREQLMSVLVEIDILKQIQMQVPESFDLVATVLSTFGADSVRKLPRVIGVIRDPVFRKLLSEMPETKARLLAPLAMLEKVENAEFERLAQDVAQVAQFVVESLRRCHLPPSSDHHEFLSQMNEVFGRVEQETWSLKALCKEMLYHAKHLIEISEGELQPSTLVAH